MSQNPFELRLTCRTWVNLTAGQAVSESRAKDLSRAALLFLDALGEQFQEARTDGERGQCEKDRRRVRDWLDDLRDAVSELAFSDIGGGR